ncbi:metallophosphoesterase family protein [Devosia nitrariae]|uniref:Serine/threonine protein phosphatase n=1 Tax=Devosia nitrariae TaxID=2071872 RepID=A0ABQ5W1W9_9HYPH|nr:metallophosphoesterase family protein [Devosia nitrariae]GLQ53665.1 serine/threonine protein phosphatase [Devosia nitrariae]
MLASWPEAVYAIGDVHGCLALLERMLSAIVTDGRSVAGEKLVVLVGDYVDRGANASGVLDRLMTPLPESFKMICIAGNHEVMMLDHLADPRSDDTWLALGGIETLMSYGVNISSYLAATPRDRITILRHHIPTNHIDFMQRLPVLLSLPGVTFVHAGLRPGIPLESQNDHDLLWMRPEARTQSAANGLIVHGHTPVDKATETDGRINIDTGAFATGRLTAVRLRQRQPPLFLAVGELSPA